MDYRIEKDSMGEIKIPNDKYWGAQTERSYENFPQNVELMPKSVIYALAIIKKAAAIVNFDLGKLPKEKRDLITFAADEILSGKYDDNFPLTVWQTGSGTQTNMNVNEVITHIANEKAGSAVIHPNDDVNMSQSSNDTFPTAMHIAVMLKIKNELIPEMDYMIDELSKREDEFKEIIKTGRTHLQDATPVRLSDEISAWTYMLKEDRKTITDSMEDLSYLAIGGTAVGTGLNAPKTYDIKMAEELSSITGLKLNASMNKFYELSTKGAITKSHGDLKLLATDLNKIANDIRFLSSGPRSGIGELIIPSNEPGSSIMPGKVNPTQVEMITMISIRVMGNDLCVSMSNASGQLELNAYMPLMIYSFDQSLTLLSKGIHSFTKNLIKGMEVNAKKIKENLDNSLMLVTSLTPHIGYDKASEIAKNAYNKDITLRESSNELGYISEEDFDKYVKPENMI